MAPCARSAAASFTGDGRQTARDGRLGQITQPVLVVWGGRDRVVPAAHAEAARSAIADVEVAIIAGRRPRCPRSRIPAAFAEILAAFLARTAA